MLGDRPVQHLPRALFCCQLRQVRYCAALAECAGFAEDTRHFVKGVRQNKAMILPAKH
jgi:hypothetical protein